MKRGKERSPHIGIYGRRNNGKSSLINRLSGQQTAIVSDVAGTTTDPVRKTLEITGFGPVVLIDTAGIDDTGDLGIKRIEKTLETVRQVDLAILVITNNRFEEFENQLVEEFAQWDVPFFVVHNKNDVQALQADTLGGVAALSRQAVIPFSALTSESIEPLIAAIRSSLPESALREPSLVGDLVSAGDIVLLITPIDLEAPAGRLILPQVQTIRELLDNDCTAIVLKEREVDGFLRRTGIRPDLAITDSSMFLKAAASVPADVPLTGFSVLFARYKGDFEAYLQGTPQIDCLKDGDRILILESCTHHVSCDDIGRVKIPRWLSDYTGKRLHYDVVAGLDKVPRPIADYALLVQCGGCMITRRQVINRLLPAKKAGIPVTNYGMTIAWVQGIYHRALAPFGIETGQASL